MLASLEDERIINSRKGRRDVRRPRRPPASARDWLFIPRAEIAHERAARRPLSHLDASNLKSSSCHGALIDFKSRILSAIRQIHLHRLDCGVGHSYDYS
ncbi:hypothetical protein EVAR_46296_1 [Eumeta japonica]|uniref:Uncharacterized protein n=1 Tax=Eumeta variegata TaxID=151549 RepID=A0A4C1XYA5_EUMVA|nr:hypothetical protein EVAR_46296_1 [Eumeta japonica]